DCEACGAMYPVADQLRQELRDRTTYVVRHFPLAGHFNSGAAALAAQAAADQGQFEPMFRRLFETQANWGEDKVSRADEFRGFAQDLSLDMGRYDASIADPKTQQRIQIDLNDGQALGVRGTPTFFVDGKEVELTKTTDLRDAIVRALEAKS
ncbi:MAG: thioredoxin domain-containing protein, partial [Phyllobacterium sp.]|nr:thioredoxin domain-containing protein [Phyllobacterium sp.]